MEKKSKKAIIIGITSLFLVMILLLGLTYAYYRTRIIGNDAETSISVVSKKLEIKYTDGSATMNMTGLIEPGFEANKKFSVENTGDEKVNFSVVLDNITNNFVRTDDWTFALKKDGEEIKNGILSLNNAFLVNSIEIDSGATYEFELIIKYINSSEDQSVDMGKNLSLRVNIADAIDNKLESATNGTLLAAIGRDNVVAEPLTIPGKKVAKSLGDYRVIGPLVHTWFTNYEDALDTYNEGAYFELASVSGRYYVYASEYKFDEETRLFSLINPESIESNDSNFATKVEGKYILELGYGYEQSEINYNKTSTSIFKLSGCRAPSESGLQACPYEYYSAIANNTEKVLATTEDDYGTSFYFRGNVKNNYVNYSGMCWRIVRVDGQGNIKLILADENNECNSSNYSVNNTTSGLINGAATTLYSVAASTELFEFEDSNLISLLDTWSKRTNKTLDTSKLVTNAIWCNDLEGTSSSRIESSATPTLKCSNISGAINYSGVIGIITADEIAFAGGVYTSYGDTTNINGYLLDNAESIYWTMTSGGSSNAYSPLSSPIYVATNSGIMETSVNTYYHAVRPVVLLKATSTISSGNGTQLNPYVIS